MPNWLVTLLSVAAAIVIGPTLVVVVEAFPGAAGGCPAGIAAVGQPHIDGGRPETTGPLLQGGVTLSLNGVPLEGKPAEFRLGEVNELVLEASGSPMKGFLIRVGPPQGAENSVDLRESIFPADEEDTLSQIAESACVSTEQVGGLTHTSADEKTSVSASLLVENEIEGLSLDVTVVMANVVTDSTYYYSNFVVNAVQAADPDEPVVATPTTSFPTAAPVMAPETDNTEGGEVPTTDGEEANEAETTTTEAPAPAPESSSRVTSVFAGTSLSVLGLIGLLL